MEDTDGRRTDTRDRLAAMLPTSRPIPEIAEELGITKGRAYQILAEIGAAHVWEIQQNP